MYRIIRAGELPILGLCGGHQLIARAYGTPLGPMRRLKEGEEDVYPDLGQGYHKEWDFTPVRVLKADPIFEGLGENPVFLEAHYWEVKTYQPVGLWDSVPSRVLLLLRGGGKTVLRRARFAG